ncbi:MAG TPA: alpha/beta hydrolase [Candidatus Saccharimonadales bacterium]|nr:alpha/beta hydrolase [Candidatus Saccharimonadales bacterium]
MNPSAQESLPWRDPSPHSVQFINVEDNIKLEVLDWGGSGRPVVLLTGLGNTAHIFDDFAPKLTSEFHVYGITRRGYGASSIPASGYSADKLGDDVLAVLNSLKLERPVLVGHSIAGEELSSVGTRHPGRVAGLIYLDAAYPYAYYDHSRGDRDIDLQELERKLERLKTPLDKSTRLQIVQELLQDNLPGFERDLQEETKRLQALPEEKGLAPEPSATDLASYSAFHTWFIRAYGIPVPEAELRQEYKLKPSGEVDKTPSNSANKAIVEGIQKYMDIRVPILSIYAIPHDYRAFYNDPAVRAAAEAADAASNEAQAKAFETGESSARIVRLTHANHYVFLSNESDVLREMRIFLARLQ